MDSTIIWQLLDTSIKVGVGALIASLFAIILMNKRQPRPVKAEQRRLDILESISSDVGHVSHVFAKYSSLVVESIRFGKRWPDNRKQELDAVSQKLVDEFNDDGGSAGLTTMASRSAGFTTGVSDRI